MCFSKYTCLDDGGQIQPETPDSKGSGSLRHLLDNRRRLIVELFQEKGYYPDGLNY